LSNLVIAIGASTREALARTRARLRRTFNYPITRLSNYPISGSARGFTLIELMVVMSLIVILATVGLVQYRQSISYTKEAVLKDDLNKLRDAIDQYYADKNQYPPTLQDLVSGGYLRAIPKDPFTNSDSSWLTVPAEPDPNNPTTQPGVYDVKSGAEGNTIDGKSLNEL
jgi:general secretion pathway protein G